MRLEGVIIKWNDEKGFGFIKPNSGQEIFIHIKSFLNQSRRPVIGDIVIFEIKVDSLGRVQVQKAMFKDGKIILPRLSIVNSIYLMVALIFLIVTGFLSYLGKMPILVLIFYLLASFLTFLIYSIDKYSAQHGHWRTKESTLHFYSSIGGWPGALFAQTTLKHKSKKPSFRYVFWFSVLINCSVFTWLLSDAGATLRSEIQSSELNTKLDEYVSLLTVHKIRRSD